MKAFYRYCDWELENEFKASGYFAVMMICYGICELIYGRKVMNIWMLFEMFLLNYVICIIHRVVLRDDIGYNNRTYYRRAAWVLVFSFLAIVITFHCFGWFHGYGIGARIFMYVCMISSYLFVWIIECLRKKQDTKQLNEQLEVYKKVTKK